GSQAATRARLDEKVRPCKLCYTAPPPRSRIGRLERERPGRHRLPAPAHARLLPERRVLLRGGRLVSLGGPVPVRQAERRVVEHALEVALEDHEHGAMPGMKDRPAMGGVAPAGIVRRRHRHHRQLVPDHEQVVGANHGGGPGDTKVAGRLARVLLLEELDAGDVLGACGCILEDIASSDGHGYFLPLRPARRPRLGIPMCIPPCPPPCPPSRLPPPNCPGKLSINCLTMSTAEANW